MKKKNGLKKKLVTMIIDTKDIDVTNDEAILKDNKCVRLSKGKDNTSVVYNEDPEKQAIYFEQIGCKKLHLVDLDAAFGRSNVNFETIKKIRKSIKSTRTFRTFK